MLKTHAPTEYKLARSFGSSLHCRVRPASVPAFLDYPVPPGNDDSSTPSPGLTRAEWCKEAAFTVLREVT